MIRNNKKQKSTQKNIKKKSYMYTLDRILAEKCLVYRVFKNRNIQYIVLKTAIGSAPAETVRCIVNSGISESSKARHICTS